MIDLQFVPQSEFKRIKTLNVSPEVRTELFALCCRINALYAIKRAGSGHIGSSFSSLDIVSWLFLNELRLPQDIYYSSKGHDIPGLYAVLIGMGLLEFDRLSTLRRLDGLPGHPDISIPHIETNTGSLGMGISKAKGMVRANRLLGKESKIYVLTGDGELQEGQFWESLQSAVNDGLHEITVIVDHNKIQSDTWVAKVSDLGELQKKFAAFGWYVERCDGHNFKTLAEVMARLKTVTDRPKIVIADTIKGKGISFMEHTAMTPEQRLYPFHSGAPSDELYTKGLGELIEKASRLLRSLQAEPLTLETLSAPERLATEGLQKLIPAYSQALIEQGQQNPQLVVLDADLVLDCGLIPFEEKFPERFFECGIAEQDMVSQAGGMALKGLLPVVHSFACFLSTRPNEQIYNNATEKTKIIYVGSLAGLLPGGPGHSHQSVRDISALAAVPGLQMLEPSCEAEVALALDYCVNQTSQSCYLRLVSIPCEIPYQLPTNYQLEWGKGVAIAEGEDAILFGYGPVLLPQAYYGAELLRKKYHINLKVVNLPWLNYVDLDWLEQTVEGYERVFTLDNHYVIGGQGDRITSGLAELGLLEKMQVRQFGILEIPRCGQNNEVLRFHRLDAESLAADMATTINCKKQ
ncbi:MAG: transketolase C-terminal domain-containing protein [Xenococcus sp. (in: cyanobacteria)]